MQTTEEKKTEVEPDPPTIETQKASRVKRLFDLVFAGLLLVMLLPLLLVVALYIKVVSKGPALYVQPRVGYGGEKFRIYKLRTMHDRGHQRDSQHREYVADLAAGNKILAKPDVKHELIPGGGLLRSLSIDELPQLWNVLKGEMSLVGPRPDLLDLSDYTPDQLRRFEVLPGITGLWQVNDKNDLTFDDMMALDIEYVDTRTLLLDLKIIFHTAFAVVKNG
jgi:lipopolysaccharide/colanic/teichoic acid biosynthesis glycosyltransferase